MNKHEERVIYHNGRIFIINFTSTLFEMEHECEVEYKIDIYVDNKNKDEGGSYIKVSSFNALFDRGGNAIYSIKEYYNIPYNSKLIGSGTRTFYRSTDMNDFKNEYKNYVADILNTTNKNYIRKTIYG